MSEEVKCPYCGSSAKYIDDTGLVQGDVRGVRCDVCGKTYAVHVSMVPHYETRQAPCMNGADCKMVPILYSTHNKCVNCGRVQRMDLDLDPESDPESTGNGVKSMMIGCLYHIDPVDMCVALGLAFDEFNGDRETSIEQAVSRVFRSKPYLFRKNPK